MKKILLTLALTLVAVVSFGQKQLPIDEKIRVGKLENGLTYYICHNETQAGMADFYLLVDVGAAQETDAQDGFAHFVEHMCLMNGTKNFPGKTLIEFFASLGCAFGDEGLNAYTTLYNTFYFSKNIPVTRESVVDSCLLALHDISHYATFDYSEIEAERGVIIEELRSKAASWRLNLKANNHIYAGTPFAHRNVLGSEEHLRTFKPGDLVEFYRTWYQPDVQAVVVIGDVDTDLVEQKIKNTFSAIPAPDKQTMKPIVEFPVRQAPEVAIVTDPEFVDFKSVFNWINKTISKELASTSSALCYDVVKKLVAGIFNERIGLENCLYFNTFCKGYERVWCGLANKNYDSSLNKFGVLCLEIERMRRYGVTEDELNRAKRKIISDAENLVRERMNVEYRDAIFNHFLYNRYLISPETELDLTKAFCELITPEELMEFIHHFTNDENLRFIYAAPERENIQYPTKEELLSVMEKVKKMEISPLVDEAFDSTLLDTLAIRPGKIEKENKGLCGSTEWVLDNGVKVIFKPTSYKKGEVCMNLVKEGGRTLLDTHELPFFEPDLFNRFQTERVFLKFSKNELMKRLSGMSVQCLVFFNEQQHGIIASATQKDIEIAMQLLYMNIAARKFDKEGCLNVYKDQYEGLENHPGYVSQKIISQTIYENQERRQMLDAEMLKNVNADDFENAINRLWGDVAGATVYIVGDIDAETLKPLVEKYIASLPAGKKGSKVIDRKDGYVKGRIVKSESIKMVTPKSVIFQLYSTHIPYSVKNQVLLEIVGSYLSILYINTIREELSGAYDQRVIVEYQREPKSLLGVTVAIKTSPKSADAIAKIAVEGVESIVENGVPDEKMKDVVETLKIGMKQKKEDNKELMQILEKSYQYNEDYIGEYEKALNSVTSDDVRKFVKKILKQDNFIQLIINPE